VLKLLLLGDSGVGKSSLLRRLVEQKYDERLPSTIGVDFAEKIVQAGARKIKLQIWDTAGQERLRVAAKNYLRGMHGVLLCYDVSSSDSFARVHSWYESFKKDAPEQEPAMYLVAMKVDRPDNKVSELAAKQMAHSLGLDYQGVSAKTGYNVYELFSYISNDILRRADSDTLLKVKAPARLPRRSEPSSFCKCC
jgi:small GTP-binding protein